MSLPFLESMGSAEERSSEPPKRMVFMCTALGLYPENLWPSREGADYESTPYLDLLAEHRQEFTLLSGLQHEDQTGRQPHDSEMTFLTSARKPGMGGFRNTISVDQFAAQQLGNVTRFSSVSLGTMKAQSQSYTSGGVMIPSQTSPAALFAQLFLEGSAQEIQSQKQRLEDGQSILDQLRDETRRLKRQSSAADNHLLEDYLDSVRAAEIRITEQQGWIDRPKPKVSAEQPLDIMDSADIVGRAQLLVNLVPLILQTDSTRVVSIMVQDHFAVPKVDGVTGNHHNLSHHGQDPNKIDQLQKIESAIVECFGDLVGQLKSKNEAGKRLLDSTTLLFGSNLGNANAHHARNLPIMVAGGGLNHGQYVAKPKGTPLCNLFLTMLENSGIETEQFGQSNGVLRW